MENRLIDIKEVSRLTGYGRSTIYKKVKTGAFPPGIVKFNRRKWWQYDVVQFMEGNVTVNIAAIPTSNPPRVKLAKHRVRFEKLSAGKPKTPPIHLDVSKKSGVSSGSHNKLSVKKPVPASPRRRSA